MERAYVMIEEVASSFKIDSKNLLLEYEKLKCYDFPSFAKIWVKMNFSLVFTGRWNEEELKHFTELAFFTVKKYLIYPKNLFTQVGALYLLYGLYYKQTYKDFVHIRLTIDDYKVLNKLVTEMKHIKQKDFLYIYNKMIKTDAFDFTIADCVVAPELKRYAKGFDKKQEMFEKKDDAAEIMEKFEEIHSSDVTLYLNVTTNKYEKALKEYLDQHQDVSFTIHDSGNVLEELQEIYKNAQTDESKSSKLAKPDNKVTL